MNVTTSESGGAEVRLLEMRLFKLKPGTGEEFDRISCEGTVPMMRRWGITVLAHGISSTDEDGYYLVRVFDSAEHRLKVSEAFYASEEWQPYEDVVMGMIAEYQAVTAPLAPGQLAQLSY
ncbi:NIPSNAP family protein [Streptomyces sp. NPDC096354]|uniref:NIPSNAP family protein n=1 Tax=Streptomyces sp. NPDC096354 TaxID=3366088 RepID=UPI003819F644